jgi:hypothetical protein
MDHQRSQYVFSHPRPNPAYRETPCGANHPLSVDQVHAAIRHAQRQGEPCYVLMPMYHTGAATAAAFTVRDNIERMIAGAEPWPSSFQPGLFPGSSRIFSVNATGMICEVFRLRF